MKLNILSIILLFSICVSAQEKIETTKTVPEAKSFVTNHQITNGGKIVRYKAIASETYLKNDSLEPVASIWSVAYIQEGVSDPAKRPVTFVFNGGPGSASVWLHMGMLGPKLVKVNSDATEDDGAAHYN
jgi:carboxypeptidase C (cathepsin A)